ncbi:MAG: beta-galactosidase trimerization domain-containing protein [Bacteroidota bacterium]
MNDSSKIILFTRLTLLLLFIGSSTIAQEADPWHIQKYDQLHWSTKQEVFQKLHPMPAGVVYIQHPDEGEEEIRWHFRKMKELGFNCLKQIMCADGWQLEDIQLIALEEGIIPWWYADAGWEPITDELLKKLGISTKTDMAEIRKHPKMQAYQTEVLRQRILKTKSFKAQNGKGLKGARTAFKPEVGGMGMELTEEGQKRFKEWIKTYYKDIEKLNHAWSLRHSGLGNPFTSWNDFEKNMDQKVAFRNYRNKMDVFRFKAWYGAENIKEAAQSFVEFDANQPFRAGGEMGLFWPSAYVGVNFEQIAEVSKEFGSFYPSTHFSWHFNRSNNELIRPFYIQASMMNDWFKGGWTGGWESTGGPQQFDGEKYASKLNAYYVDAGALTQFYLSQMAAGFKGFGIWCWSVRSAGKEGGEYALLDRNNQVTPRAIQMGQMGKAMEKYRDEIWEAHKEPLVGILNDWNNDAAWGAMSVRGPDRFRMFPVEARIGVSRALMNANVPFEFVTPDDLKNGLVNRYPIIYLPAIISLDTEILEILEEYVKEGGRLVLDLPGGKFDQYTALLPTGEGSRFARLFGVTLNNYQFSGSNKTLSLAGQEWTGFVVDMTPKAAVVKANYNNGKPAITEHNYGKGQAILIGLDMAHQCFKPNHKLAESLLVDHTLGSLSSPYQCEGVLVYRLSNSEADHYYFINDGPAKTVAFSSSFSYKEAVDVLSGEIVDLTQIQLNADDGRWIRMEK